MAYEVINTKKAAEILGVSYGYVIQLIHKKVITSAYYGAPDGYCGNPGYIIDREEIETLAREGVGKRIRRNKTEKQAEPTVNRDDIKQALEEVQTCLGLLTEVIAKLREEL